MAHEGAGGELRRTEECVTRLGHTLHSHDERLPHVQSSLPFAAFFFAFFFAFFAFFASSLAISKRR